MTSEQVIEVLQQMKSLAEGKYVTALDIAIEVMKENANPFLELP